MYKVVCDKCEVELEKEFHTVKVYEGSTIEWDGTVKYTGHLCKDCFNDLERFWNDKTKL